MARVLSEILISCATESTPAKNNINSPEIIHHPPVQHCSMSRRPPRPSLYTFGLILGRDSDDFHSAEENDSDDGYEPIPAKARKPSKAKGKPVAEPAAAAAKKKAPAATKGGAGGASGARGKVRNDARTA